MPYGEPTVRIELTTPRLQVTCSTAELSRLDCVHYTDRKKVCQAPCEIHAYNKFFLKAVDKTIDTL